VSATPVRSGRYGPEHGAQVLVPEVGAHHRDERCEGNEGIHSQEATTADYSDDARPKFDAGKSDVRSSKQEPECDDHQRRTHQAFLLRRAEESTPYLDTAIGIVSTLGHVHLLRRRLLA
jgi:hypothetical protein